MVWNMSSLKGRFVIALMLAAGAACSKDAATAPPEPSAPVVLLKDIVIPSLPSPYYHFAYDATGRIDSVSFASQLTNYDVQYAGGRISELRNNILVNHDRLVYTYDGAGHATEVQYTDASGNVFTRVTLTYAGNKLASLERRRLAVNVFILDKALTFSYGADGNLSDITTHRPAIAGFQPEATYNDHFEGYDSGINVDGFGLIHEDFFDHLVLLPDVHFQKSNARRVTRTGSVDNYQVDFTYTYDAKNRPLTQTGDLVYKTGTLTGQHFTVGATYTYYD